MGVAMAETHLRVLVKARGGWPQPACVAGTARDPWKAQEEPLEKKLF